MTADLSALIARLEAAEVGSRELDWGIAKTLFGFSMWKSKHGYWNINWPDDWPYSSRPLHCSVPGRSPDDIFDPRTGLRLPPEAEPTDWLEDIECPLWTTSLDAALALAERVLPEETFWQVGHSAVVNGQRLYNAEVFPPNATCETGNPWGHASTPALALVIATLRAKLDGYEAEGEVNKNPKAQEG